VYARWKGIPSWAALPSLAAFLIVYPFYLVPAFPRVREQLAGPPLPGFLIAAAVLPYLASCTGAIQFQFLSFVKLIALALALGLWYRVLPAAPVVDVGFLVLVVAVKIGGYTTPIYSTPFKGVELGRLGDIALFNITVLVLMLERRIRETGFGFLPTRNDWRIGARNYLYFLPVGAALGFLLNAGHLVRPSDPLKLTLYFLAFLFVLTLAEEFLFRGVLQQWIEDWTWSRRSALILTSILFGVVHLWFRHFPNWQWVIIAGTLGWFCGRARNQAGSIRAAMVTHTLVITTWRAFIAA
jgi:membrane protease YdiL (CAAX protease family)